MGRVIIGVAGFGDESLIQKGNFYPGLLKTPTQRLTYYAQRFGGVEDPTTFFSLPSYRISEERAVLGITPSWFHISPHAFALFSGFYTAINRLPREVQYSLPAVPNPTAIYPRDIPPFLLDQLWVRFRESLLPLHRAGKLGPIFFRLPEWFSNISPNREYLLECQLRLPDYRLAIEFHHASWLDKTNREDTMQFLWDNHFIYTCVSEPQGFPSSVPPLVEVTSDVAFFRFNGLNKENWMRKGVPFAEKYMYLYTEEQLQQWAAEIVRVSEQVKYVYVTFANMYANFAITNAQRMQEILGSTPTLYAL